MTIRFHDVPEKMDGPQKCVRTAYAASCVGVSLADRVSLYRGPRKDYGPIGSIEGFLVERSPLRNCARTAVQSCVRG